MKVCDSCHGRRSRSGNRFPLISDNVLTQEHALAASDWALAVSSAGRVRADGAAEPARYLPHAGGHGAPHRRCILGSRPEVQLPARHTQPSLLLLFCSHIKDRQRVLHGIWYKIRVSQGFFGEAIPGNKWAGMQ